MTLIHITLTVPDKDGTSPAAGRMRFTPTRRVSSDTSILLPDGWTGYLDETGQLSVNLMPSGVDWVWRVDELMTGGTTRYVVVPDSNSPLEYTALTDIDPETLNPSDGVVPAWTEAVTQVREAASAAAASETGAHDSATQAAASAADAIASKAAASSSAGAASVSEVHAAASASAASASAESINDQLAQAQRAASSASESQASSAQSADASASSAQASASSQIAAADNATTASTMASQAKESATSAKLSASTATNAVESMPVILTAANYDSALTLSAENPAAWVYYPEGA